MCDVRKIGAHSCSVQEPGFIANYMSVKAKVIGPHGKQKVIRILFDSGSEYSLVRSSLVNDLGYDTSTTAKSAMEFTLLGKYLLSNPHMSKFVYKTYTIRLRGFGWDVIRSQN